MNATNTFKLALVTTLVIKLILGSVLPLSGDEAYFVLWAQHLDFGYYDHPPMVGWFLHLMLFISKAEVVLRLPAILTSTFIAIGIYRLLKNFHEEKAALVAILFLISPLNILNVLVTTDTPLILFVFLSVASLYKALQHQKASLYILSGIFFGLAFLSKYFAVLIGVSYLFYFAISTKSSQKTSGFALLFLASLPFALINLYWNYTHCWDNILFNLYTRNEDSQFAPGNIATFLAVQLYLMTPPFIYFIYKQRDDFVRKIRRDNFLIFFFIFTIPMLVFTMLSFKKIIGLHWVLAFYPALYLLSFQLISKTALKKLLKFMTIFSVLHLIAILIIAFLPMEVWKQHRLYNGIVFMFKTDKIIEQVRPYEHQKFLLATDGYSPSATIAYHYGKNFFVFGEGGFHARQDDMLTDFRQYQGHNILILAKSEPDMKQYIPYFNKVEKKSFTVRDATFHMVLGYDFNYEYYKEGVLRQIKHKYYKIPEYLPHTPCYFCEKYFPGESS